MLSASSPIRISHPKEEGILQVSKWIKTQVFLNAEEMQALIGSLGPVFFVVVSEPVKMEDAILTASNFIEKYAKYVSQLSQGKIPAVEEFRRFFSCAMTTSIKDFYAMSISDGKFLIKPIKPVLQLQAHHFFYSHLDGKFHPMVLSSDSISWGIQFSYPQLYQDPKSRRVIKVTDVMEFPNTALFSKLMKWMRSFTLPTPFEVAGKRVNAPIRIGKNSLDWVSHHPQLRQKGIHIAQL